MSEPALSRPGDPHINTPATVQAAAARRSLKTVSLNALLDLAIAGSVWMFFMIIGMFI
jgi:hypothetical protein